MSKYLLQKACLGFVFTTFAITPFAASFATSMNDAIRSAITTHPTIEEAIAVQSSVHEDFVKERSNYFPVLSATTAAGRVYGDNATSRGLSVTRGAGYSYLWEGSLSISQLLFDGLRTPRLVASSRAREAAATKSLAEVQNSLALQTALSYLNAAYTQESLKIVKQYDTKFLGHKNKIRKMVSNGAADQSEAQEAEIVSLQLHSVISDLEGQFEAASIELSQLTGGLLSDDLQRPAPITYLPESADVAISMAMGQHPKLASNTLQNKAAKLQVGAQKSALFPTVLAELSTYHKDVDDIIGGEVEDNRALVRANWGFSLGGAEIANIRQAKHEHVQAQARKKQTVKQLEETIRTAYSNLETAEIQKNIFSKKLDTQKKILDTRRVQFEGGKVKILHLLQTEYQIMGARKDLIDAEYRLLAAQYSVLASLGNLLESLESGQ